jgi:two-component system, NtrC family, sensor kinase
MPSCLSLRTSLARSTLIKMGIRIAVVIALSTFLSYLHISHALRTEALGQLEQHVVERGEREQAIFVLAEDNHTVLKQALEEEIRSLQGQDVSARFDALFMGMPDGTVRNRPEGFDGTRMVGVFVPRGVRLDEDIRRRILAAQDVLTRYGPAFHTRFTDTFITLPEGPLILYWPERPTWCLDVEPDFSVINVELFSISLPENNPQRRTAWAGVFMDPVAGKWIVTASTPLDMEGRHVATLSHDVLLEELLERTTRNHLPGAYNLIFRDDGHLIAHPELSLEMIDAPERDVLRVAPERQAHLQGLLERLRGAPGQRVLEFPEYEEYLAATRLEGPDWNFVTVLPARVVSRPARLAARYVLLLGLVALLLELAIMYWVLQQQITRPLLVLTQATDRVAAGDFHVELETSRGDELGLLASAFQVMADQLQQREEALRQANAGLEQRVEARTRELKEVHQQLVVTARQAGMAEVATNVLHNVGNVLNSVCTSAQLARERLSGLKLEQVSRVTQLLHEHQGDLATFLTQDERGRHVTPFLRELGQNLVDERTAILTLLDDVGRYTEHIGDIVKVQQNYARTPRVHEPVLLQELVEDALRINQAGLIRHGVEVERRLADLPPVLTDKNKVLMILVNLVSNAKYALEGRPAGERLLTVRLERSDADHLRVEVHDNGMGIAPELLTRIFQYGFTTRQEGHGFGLHSSALAAQELSGVLMAHSEGPGCGATFTLELPYHPVRAVG